MLIPAEKVETAVLGGGGEEWAHLAVFLFCILILDSPNNFSL